MTWTTQEAETILREQWDDAEGVGGFANPWQREVALKQLSEEWGDALDGFSLLGQTMWSNYEEGGEVTLWLKVEDNSLWMFESGSTVYGSYGEDFLAEVRPAELSEWLCHVEANIRHAETFTAY